MTKPLALILACLTISVAAAQDAPKRGPLRGSFVEERAARKLLDAGDSRLEANEARKALEIWQSVIERYPRSRAKYDAHMRLGKYYLERERAYDRARDHFQAATSEENRNDEQRAEATVKTGVCFYEVRNFGKCFQIMRDVIERFPASEQVNASYYYIGLGHFQLGHYSRAIQALEKVGTALSTKDNKREKAEAGKRLFIKIDDADLAALEPGKAVEVMVETTSGDTEKLSCFQLGRNVRVALGNVPTRLGKPQAYNGFLEVRGDDKVKISYIDEHTADRKFNRPVLKEIPVVGNAIVQITDGAFSETLRGVVLGKAVNVQINDADRDLSEKAETIQAVVEVYRRKTEDELNAELAEKAAKNSGDAVNNSITAEDAKPNPLKLVDRVKITLTESLVEHEAAALTNAAKQAGTEDATDAPKPDDANAPGEAATAKPEDEEPAGVYTGVFRTVVPLVKSEDADQGDGALQALTGDVVRVTYLDERHVGEGVNTATASATCVDGNLGGVRVTRSVISDEELRIKTRLKTADALTNIGNRYKEFGLKKQADNKYGQALAVCEEVTRDAGRLGGKLLEQTYVQLWKIYYEMDNLNLAAAMAQRLQREFPNSGFVDDALLQLADVARKQGNVRRAIGIYNRLVNMKESDLRGEAQFGIASCYEQMADASQGAAQAQLMDRAFQEFKKVFDNFPESGRVGEAVSKMANHYYQQKDFARAVDTFEAVLTDYPDAKFLDVILFNYGRCLYRMKRRGEARSKFDQLISEFPESPLAADAKKISDALARAGGS